MERINMITLMIEELDNKKSENAEMIKLFMEFNSHLCNDVLYTDSRYKDTTIIITNMFKKLMIDFCKEVYDCVNGEGVYKK